ncbi:polyribonucleotide nucleotidyltransferase [Candidatus Curtissbacteria bacterium RIFCSPHIGHO2_01_FULL_41_11]|uniref:Polyribonucleotide nucleotidyltransferase n=1 Tax=Candidatus Curtissbacteria bacterium RIFCSPHIGHO2_01_FULL_41_11 TaxID=1797711 RepID=A0A1F5G3I5_9BACT|nr:MAG: polyribonucleotide nucleotidyltransferase [Candidatus Curtissbacteria bacterium RIFCSPHIGHO2_01_FULL_41_11]
MSAKVIRKELDLAGKKLVLETGELAGHANGSVLAQYGDTVVLATAVSKEAPPDMGFFPLSVDYEERLYAGGKISTSRFIKREGRPSEEAILTGRMIDRSIRPLFPKDYQAEVQVIVTVLSVDGENDPDVISLIAASAALSISDIPWNGPLSGIRVGKQNSDYFVNPTEEEKKFSDLDLVVASTKDEIVMIEATSNQIDEKTMAGAFEHAVEAGKQVIKLVEDFVKEAGREKQKYEPEKTDPVHEKMVKDFIEGKIIKDLETPGKAQDEAWFGESLDKLKEEFIKEDEATEGRIDAKVLGNILDDAVTDFMRKHVLTKKIRIDGRKPEEIRPISIKVPVLPRTHGSAIFQRGETQVLSIATLGSPSLEQLIEGMGGEAKRRYMHHYNFPPFSTGEVKRLGSPGRREIGHGALAEKAIVPILPSQDEFPYTVRVVSEVLSSAGSTSQASVCGSTLALMDAGVPIKDPVSGISIGLITDKTDKSKYVLLTDIAYQEDSQGDMDFKVSGTKNGITAIQMDIKLNGVPTNVLAEALERAKAARLSILEMMTNALPASREKVSPYAPTVILVKIDPSKIGEVIGSGGRVINKIIDTTGAAVDIEDDGTVTISAKEPEAAQKAAQWVEGIVKEPLPGEVYEGPVKRIVPFGAFVEILPGKEGLVHISKMAPYHVEKVEDIVKLDQIVKVKVSEVDDMGRLNLSMRFDGGDENDRSPSGDRQSRPQRRPQGRFDRRQSRDRGPRKRY